MNHWYPQLYQGRYAVEPDRLPEDGYHLSEDLVDNAISWVENQQAITPERPFFTYLALGARTRRSTSRRSGATSTPAGSTTGWDAQREQTLARQKELGIVPESARAGPVGRGRPALGRARRDREAGRRAVHGDLRRLRRARRRPGRPVRRRARGDGRASTTRCSSTCSATTAPPARAARAAPSASTSSGTASRTTPPTWPPGSTRSATRRRTPSTRSAGRWP